MRKYISSMLVILLAAGCAAGQPSQTSNVPEPDQEPQTETDHSPKAEPVDIKSPADMSDYIKFHNEDSVFYEINVSDLVDKAAAGEDFALIISYSDCPWCNDALPVLNEVAKEFGKQVAYINIKPKDSEGNPVVVTDFRKVVDLLSDYIQKDDDGEPTLLVPLFAGFKDGNAVGVHMSTVDTYDPKVRELNPEETERLKQIYRDIFQQVYAN